MSLLDEQQKLSRLNSKPLPLELATERDIGQVSHQDILPDQRTLDDQTHGLMADNLRRILDPIENDQRALTAGIDIAGNNFGPGVSESNALGGPDNFGLQEALAKRSDRDLGGSRREIDRSALLQAKTNRADQAAQLSQQYGRFEQIKLNNYAILQSKLEQGRQLLAQEKAEQGALLGSILGLVGTALGGIIGGPAGAKVGGGAGQAVGQSQT